MLVDISARVGDLVGAPGKNCPVCTVADVQWTSAVTQISERVALSVKRGDAARIYIDALPEKVFAAKVSRVGYNVEHKLLPVEIEVANADGRLRPGMGGVAAVALAVHRDVLSIPRGASDGSTVYTVVDGRAVEKRIKLGGGTFDERVEVLSGLKEGEVVISSLADPKRKKPNWRLHPRVEIVHPAAGG